MITPAVCTAGAGLGDAGTGAGGATTGVKLGVLAGGAVSTTGFVIGVLVAFLPAVVIGLIAGKYIKEILFNPWVVCFSLIVGHLKWRCDHQRHDRTLTHLAISATDH